MKSSHFVIGAITASLCFAISSCALYKKYDTREKLALREIAQNHSIDTEKFDLSINSYGVVVNAKPGFEEDLKSIKYGHLDEGEIDAALEANRTKKATSAGFAALCFCTLIAGTWAVGRKQEKIG